MKRFAWVFFFCWLCLSVWGQPPVQTLVPRQTISMGEAFQVQYVVNELPYFEGLQTPQFGPDFKQVNGPVMYNGTIQKEGKTIAVHNYSFTLVPLRKGRLPITGATAVYRHKKEVSPPSFVMVADQSLNEQDADVPWDETEKKNEPLLLVKASVNKKECFVGEPIVATFMLLSKVVTAAEVIKNPGFYGFSVLEMSRAGVQLVENDAITGYEKHQLRKVQLYPMQAGKLVIDEMTVHNYAQLTDTVTGFTTEKEIILTSTPISIEVKPLPPAKGETFTGAVGNFVLNAKLKEDEFKAGQTGQLKLTLKGAGNFLQLATPDIAWPAGIEGFEPKVSDDLRKEAVPEQGEKVYLYSFTGDSGGTYTIPPVSLTFFDPQTQSYATTTTDSLHFRVAPQKGLKTFIGKVKSPATSSPYVWIAIAAAALFLSGLLFWLAKRRKTNVVQKEAVPTVPTYKPLSYTAQLKALQPSEKDFKGFYQQLQQLVLQFLKSQYGIGTSSKATVHQQIDEAPFTPDQKKDLRFIIEECESVQYYNATPSLSFNALQAKAIATVSSLEKEK